MPAAVAAVAAAANNGDVTVSRPTGTTDGDLLVAIAFSDPDDPTFTIVAPSGWGLEDEDTGPGGCRCLVYTKEASSEPTSWTWTMSAGTSNGVHVLRVTGAAGIEIAPVFGGSSSSTTSHVAPSVNPAEANSLLICGTMEIYAGSGVATHTPPSGMTEQTDLAPSDFSPGYQYSSVATQQLSGSGATGTKTFTSSISSVGGSGGSVTVSLAVRSLQTGAATGAATAAAAAAGSAASPGHVTGAATAAATVSGSAAATGSVTGAATAAAAVAGSVSYPFPRGELPVRFEMLIDGAWVDITDLTYTRSLVEITRGRPDEGSSVEHTKCPLVVNNRSGDFSPRNPLGQWFGTIGRNIPVRASLDGPVHMTLAGEAGSYASTPDSAGTSVTGDIDVRIDVTLWDWTNPVDLAGKYGSAGTRSWALYRTFDGLLAFRWSTDGTAFLERFSTIPIPVPAGGAWRMGLRATLDVNDGAGGHVVTFYTTRETVAGEEDLTTATWVQLGDPITTAGTTSIFDGTAATYAGAVQAGSTALLEGRLWELQVRSGIGGSIVAGPRFRDQAAAVTSFADPAGNTWTLAGDADLSDRDVRVTVEVSAWPPRWDLSENDIWTPAEGAGILRRLGAGDDALASTLTRAYSRLSGVVAYWPCEDEGDAGSLASALSGHQPMRLNGERADLAAFDGFAASKPIPTLKATSELRAAVPPYTPPSGQSQVRCLVAIPAAGSANGQSVLEVVTTGSAITWQIRYGTGGTLTIRAFAADGTSLLNDGPWGFQVDGTARMWSLELTQDGADIDWAVATLDPGGSSGLVASGTVTSQTFGRILRVIGSPLGGIPDISMGHFVVQDTVTSLFELGDQLAAYAGETAGRRIERLCSEEGVPFRVLGDLDDTAALGTQQPAKLLDLLQEAADADLGILFEPRDFLGLCYRPRTTLCNQIPSATVPYGSSTKFEPVDDDRDIRNDVKVTRTGGSSSPQVDTDGPLGVDAVGRYPQAVTRNVAADSQLEHLASWLLHLGTIDEPRIPEVELGLEHPSISDDTALTRRLRDLDLGDRLVVTDPPSFAGTPDDLTQLVQGLAETLGVHEHGLVAHTTPESPWHVAVLDDPASRYSSDGTELTSSITDSQTSIQVTTPTGPLWTTDPADFPLDWRIGRGEVVTVTGISGTTNPQTATVTRGVNGITRAWDANTVVELADPVYWAL